MAAEEVYGGQALAPARPLMSAGTAARAEAPHGLRWGWGEGESHPSFLREREMNRNRNKRRENEREGGRQISKIQNRYNNEKLQKQLCVHSYAHGRMAYIYTYTYMPQDEKMYPQKTNIESRTKARDIF